jgi:hypothetical protein
MKNAILFLLFCLAQLASAQKTATARSTFYYENDKFELTNDHRNMLFKLLDTLDINTIKKVYLKGHTDQNADSVYNMKLSAKRTFTLGEFLVSKGLPQKLIYPGYFGEVAPAKQGTDALSLAKNRRVEMVVVYNIKENTETNKDTIATIVLQEPACPLINISNDPNMVLLLDSCVHEQNKNCLKVINLNTPEQIRANGINMFDEKGNPLQSDGMFKFEWNKNCNPCNDIEVKWRLTEKEYREYGFDFYQSNPQNSWNTMSRRRVKRLVINKEVFYEITLDCQDITGRDWYNKDKKIKLIYTKVKVPRKFRIMNTSYIFRDSTFSYFNTPKTETIEFSNKLKTFPFENLYIQLYNKRTKDTIMVAVKQENARKFKLFKRYLISSFRWRGPIYLLGGWPHLGLRNKSIYYFRKYRLTKADVIAQTL